MFRARVVNGKGVASLTEVTLLSLMSALEERSDGCCYSKAGSHVTEGFVNSLNFLNPGINASVITEGAYDAGPMGSSNGHHVLKIPINLFALAAILDTKFGSQNFHIAVLEKKEIVRLTQDEMIALLDSLEERPDGSCFSHLGSHVTNSFINSLNYLDQGINAGVVKEGSYDCGPMGYSDGYPVLKIPMNKLALADILDRHEADLIPSSRGPR